MTQFTSYVSIMNEWPSLEAFGKDIGIDGAHARTLKMRDTLPSGYWNRVEEAAKKRRLKGIDVKVLADIAAKKMGTESGSHKA